MRQVCDATALLLDGTSLAALVASRHPLVEAN